MQEETKKLSIHWEEIAVNGDAGVCVGVACHHLCKQSEEKKDQ